MTWSIIARDDSGRLGVAVASKFFSVGSLCAHRRRGVGAVSTQALMNPLHGLGGLDRMAAGQTAEQAIAGLTGGDAGRDQRQVLQLPPTVAQRPLPTAPVAIWPGLSIFLLVLSFNLLGDGLRDALDPRQR